jgi:hypothetical protein
MGVVAAWLLSARGRKEAVPMDWLWELIAIAIFVYNPHEDIEG